MFSSIQIISLVAALASFTSAFAIPEPQAIATDGFASAPASTCTTTKVLYRQMDYSPTSTVFLNTATSTIELQCEGCELTSFFVGGPGPVLPGGRTTTVTSDVTTSTVYACIPTDW